MEGLTRQMQVVNGFLEQQIREEKAKCKVFEDNYVLVKADKDKL